MRQQAAADQSGDSSSHSKVVLRSRRNALVNRHELLRQSSAVEALFYVGAAGDAEAFA